MKGKKTPKDVVRSFRMFCARNAVLADDISATFYADKYLDLSTKEGAEALTKIRTYIREKKLG